jgi:hypothetical protein
MAAIKNPWDRRDLLRLATGAIATMPATLTARDTVRVIRGDGLSASELGARFDGRTDDSAALQRGIDEAARQQRPLVLPSGTARLNVPLDLKGRHVALLGDPTGNTILKAARALPCILDAEDPSETIDSPLFLYGLTLDGSRTTATGLRLRYRHRTMFDTLAIGACETGVDELDSWLGRRINCRTRATATGWRLRGANHSSLWIGCSFSDARDVHLDIGASGTANDGNDALFFQACDIEYGAGDGVRIAAGATATFDTCYMGEGIEGDVLRNAGVALIRGGTLFVGHKVDRLGIRALAGSVTINEAAVRGQRFGTLDRLVGGSDNGSTKGKVIFRDVDLQLKLGGDPVLTGDVLGNTSMRVFAPILGRNWQSSGNDVIIEEASVADARRVRCQRTVGANPLIGFAGMLQDTAEARIAGPAYIVIVYEASAPVELKATSGLMSKAPWRLIGTLPVTHGVATYVKVDVPVEFARFALIELLMRAKAGDEMVLHHSTISDSSMIGAGLPVTLACSR